jgi:predicted transcriptional regulator
MAKDKERNLAKELYFQNKDQKEIAVFCKVSEKTVSNWVKKFNWKEQRDARVNGNRKHIAAVKDVIGRLTEERLALFEQIKQADNDNDMELSLSLAKKGANLADEISKYNKTLENLDKQNRISLSVYIEVMDQIFNDINRKHPKLYQELLDFQEQHLSLIASKYS